VEVQNNKVIIARFAQGSKQTRGHGIVLNENRGEVLTFATLELPWLHNANSISCIPAGKYALEKYASSNNGDSFAILDVEGRSHIRIHKGNFTSQIRGCILVGTGFKDLNADGELDVVLSALTISKMYNVLPDKTTIQIINV